MAVVLGLLVAKRNNVARVALLCSSPIFCLVDSLEVFRGATARPLPQGYGGVALACSFLLMVIPYGLMFVFYSRHRVIRALFMLPEEDHCDGPQSPGNAPPLSETSDQ